MFVALCGKRKKDYRKVLAAILEALPKPPLVISAVVDFELSISQSLPRSKNPGLLLSLVSGAELQMGHAQ